jgi:hypothetical protein
MAVGAFDSVGVGIARFCLLKFGTVLRDGQRIYRKVFGLAVKRQLATIEVHLASTKFVKAYDLVFNKGDEVTVVGTKVQFEGVETIFAREVTRGSETFVFRDKDGTPIW